ncbi:MAG: hypothetical protein JST92_00715 [Deltaproteobacteria bacterium]|nr:hypothetical protein [Deltaproteobacteria bacterium]
MRSQLFALSLLACASLTAGAASAASCPASCFAAEAKAPSADSSLSPARKQIVAAAQSYLHQISDCGGTGGEKLGADLLEAIYKSALQGNYSAKTMRANVRKANAGEWSGPWSYGGLFSIAVLQKAGMTGVAWGVGKPVGRAPTWGHKGVQAGDIAVWDGSNQHSIVEKIEGDVVHTIDAQQECGGVLRKTHSLSKMAAFYVGPGASAPGTSASSGYGGDPTPAPKPSATPAPAPAPAPKPGGSSGASSSGSGASGASASVSPISGPAQNPACNYCYANEVTSAPALDPSLSKERRRIIAAAATYLHKVSDCGGSGGEKFGADVLEKVYSDALEASIWKPSLMRSHVRKASSGKWDGPWSWCGIWAVAAVRKGGFSDVTWGVGHVDGRKPVWGHKGVKPGDIAFWEGGLNHHDIVEKIDGDTVWTLDGNQECSGIMRKKRKLSNMGGYYNIAND